MTSPYGEYGEQHKALQGRIASRLRALDLCVQDINLRDDMYHALGRLQVEDVIGVRLLSSAVIAVGEKIGWLVIPRIRTRWDWPPFVANWQWAAANQYVGLCTAWVFPHWDGQGECPRNVPMSVAYSAAMATSPPRTLTPGRPAVREFSDRDFTPFEEVPW